MNTTTPRGFISPVPLPIDELQLSTLSHIEAVRAPRFTHRFRTRVFTYISLLSLATLFVAGTVLLLSHRGQVAHDRSRRANTLLTSLATQSEIGAYAVDSAQCELPVRSILAEEDVAYVGIYDRHGNPIVARSHSWVGSVPPPRIEVMRHILRNPQAPIERFPGQQIEDLYKVIISEHREPAEALFTGPGTPAPALQVVGVARIGLSQRTTQQQFRNIWYWLVILALAVFFVGIIAAIFISRRVSRPLAELTFGVEQLRAGRLDVRVRISANDEIGQLGLAFNRMAARLSETMNALETLNRGLENEVVRRTVAIQRAAAFTALLNAPLGHRSGGADQITLRNTGGEATGALARLLDSALHALLDGTDAYAGAVLLGDEESVDFHLRIAWHVGILPAELGRLPNESELQEDHPWYDGRRLVIPLVLGNELVGCLLLYATSQPADDRIHFASHAASQLAIAVGNVRAFAAQLHLARELRERNIALAKQRDQLQEMNRLKSEFLANTSHELRTPLNAILGYTELIADGVYGTVTEDQKKSLDGIEESSRNLLALINNILDLSKVEAGKITLHAEEIDLVSIARSVLVEASPLAKHRPYQLKLTAPPSLMLHTDGAKVKQILTNLVSNAIKFTTEGEVEMIIADDAEGGATLHVRDTGIGIRPEDQRIIFEEFRQVDGSYTRTFGGTGLGLAIARRFSELLGGQLQVESRLNAGSTFILRLPREPPRAPTQSTQIRRPIIPPPVPSSGTRDSAKS